MIHAPLKEVFVHIVQGHVDVSYVELRVAVHIQSDVDLEANVHVLLPLDIAVASQNCLEWSGLKFPQTSK